MLRSTRQDVRKNTDMMTSYKDAETLMKRYLNGDESKFNDLKGKIAVNIYNELKKEEVDLDVDELFRLAHLSADKFLINWICEDFLELI